jgi:hypothetical protein
MASESVSNVSVTNLDEIDYVAIDTGYTSRIVEHYVTHEDLKCTVRVKVEAGARVAHAKLEDHVLTAEALENADEACEKLWGFSKSSICASSTIARVFRRNPAR